MKRFSRLLVVTSVLAGFGSAFAAGNPLADLRTERSRLVSLLETQERETGRTRSQLDELSSQIRALKKGPARESALLKGYRLRSLMAQAQDLSEKLEGQTSRQRDTWDALQTNAASLRSTLDRTIEAEGSVSNDPGRSREERRTAAFLVQKLTWERLALALQEDLTPIPTSTAGLAHDPMEAGEAAARLDAIRDFQRRLVREVALLETELVQSRRQRFVRDETSHLLDEEAFFGERGFVRGGVSRTKKEDPLALARTSTGGEDPSKVQADPNALPPPPSDRPPDAVPPAAPPPDPSLPAESASLPADGLAPSSGSSQVGSEIDAGSPVTAENLAGNARLNVSTGELALPAPTELLARDPLAQLATELGMKNPSSPSAAQGSGDLLTRQIRWLELRIHTAKGILGRLEELAHRVERHTPR